MASVGLLYVGAVLFVNGLMLLGYVEARAAAVLNLFVGSLQVITPTVLIVQAGTDAAGIMAASGLYLFGFTYLYVGIGLLTNLHTSGVGWFSLFVAILAVAYALVNFADVRDPVFGVIWLYWSFLWLLFFLVLGLNKETLRQYVGWITVVEAWVTCVIPALFLLTGRYAPSPAAAVVLAAFGVIAAVILWLVTAPRHRTLDAEHSISRSAGHPA